MARKSAHPHPAGGQRDLGGAAWRCLHAAGRLARVHALPPLFFGVLVAMILTDLGLVEIVKGFYYRRYPM
jgi:hypothetical protein